MGPSLFWLPSRLAWPRTMSLKDIMAVKKEFVQAAALCKEAGFDCLEIHCGHGYLLSQFLTPIVNRRKDEYGGDAERRARFPADVMREVRAEVGEMPIVVKMNSDDGLPIPGGLGIDDALVAAKAFAVAGADAVIPSYGYTSLNGLSMLRGGVPLSQMAEALPDGSKWICRLLGPYVVPKVEFEPVFLRDSTRRFVEALQGTETRVIYVGGADSFSNISEVLSDGCAAVQLGRPLIREPWFVKKLQKGFREAERPEDVDVSSTCIRCNRCTLASLDPVRFPAGCVFMRPGDGRDIEDLSYLEAAPRL